MYSVDKRREEIYSCWLDLACWLTSACKHKLLRAAGSAENIYNMDENAISGIVGLKNSEVIRQHKKAADPFKIYEDLIKKGIRHTFYMSDDFPKRMLNIPDPPFGLFYKGRLPEADVPSVAVIGARKCSEYGRCMAERFASELAKKGVNIVSGMAIGIDGISQRAAIAAGGKSYGVLGCGVDVIYPKSNEPLYNRLIENGAVISEYPVGTEPKPMLFPLRNRLISALSDAVLVVEAREKSGTLITVDMALEQGREVYTVPGRCTDNLSRGCNGLLRQGAIAAMTAEDIIEDMKWEDKLSAHEKNKPVSSYNKAVSNLSPIASDICKILDIIPVTQDTIIALLRERGNSATVPQVCQALVELELKGMVERSNGQYKLFSEMALK